MNHKTTEELSNEIKISTDIKDYLTQNKEEMQLQSLTDALHSLLNEKKSAGQMPHAALCSTELMSIRSFPVKEHRPEIN